jgi:hypothetical protein
MIAHRDVFDAEYTAHLNRLRSDAAASLEGWKADVGKIGREMDRLVDAIVGDVPAVEVKDRMIELDARTTELDRHIANGSAPFEFIPASANAIARR